MSTLKEMISTQLPLNRKERFYTGTVLPMIIAKDNFRHLHLLFEAINVTDIPPIVALKSSTNIEFFTEYSLRESLHRTGRSFIDLPSSKDTPDLVMLIDGTTKVLFAIEAKMYDSTSRSDLISQMNVQTAILNSVSRSLGVSKIYHFALLPKKLADSLGDIGFPIITWELIAQTFCKFAADDYFLTILNLALDSYDQLAATGISFGKNNEEFMMGQTIYSNFKNNSLKNLWMGRRGGIDGQKLADDISSGKWRSRKYETRQTSPSMSNKNWFQVEEFIALIENP